MTTVLYLLFGALTGLLIGYLMCRLLLLKNHIPREVHAELQATLSRLQIELATKLSRQEVETDYVNRELHQVLRQQLGECQQQLQEKKEAITALDTKLVELTAESERRLSKEEVEKNYVARNAFNIVKEDLEKAKSELEGKTGTITELTRQLAELKKAEENLKENISTFKQQIHDLHTISQEQFKNVASQILEEKRNNLSSENQKELTNILNPLKNDLTQFREKVEATRKEDIQDLTSLKKEIESLQKLNNQLSDDAKNLANALKSDVKMQGNWGEDRLNMILELEGLQKYVDFTKEETYRDEEQDRNRRPDFILRLPNAKHIIIDSKVSTTAYVNYFNAPTPEQKKIFLNQHLQSVTDNIDRLTSKNYQSLTGLKSPDFVFMFLHYESALTLALNERPDLLEYALKKNIAIVTPSTIIATFKIVKALWQKENQVKNVQEIFRQCGELYNKFVTFLEDMDRLGTGLHNASKAHADAMNSLKDGTRRGNTIIGRFETIKRLEAKTSKQIPEKYLGEISVLPSDEEERTEDIIAEELPGNELLGDDELQMLQ